MKILLSAAAFAPVALERVMPYASEKMRQKLEALPQKLAFKPTHAVVALFEGRVKIGASGGDYSQNKEILRKDCERLRLEHHGYSFAESGNAWPLPAVQAARLAGLGVIGLNGLLFAPGLGSNLSIGAVYTDAECLRTQCPFNGDEGTGYCCLCGECVRRCPTGALTYQGGKRGFEPLKCLSYLRQKGGTASEREGYYGCDICQDVCPMNR
jgi:epoxyqueuosine reductase QueG